ncbi:unnamed protein product [Vitrella brassicaformis CCMP3155]|uniref:SPX domain-containing protein n=1 Tax=Vitrella brassicaformis (strain CCMP3155) TaxID=1169540 RepID=A0A0G4ESB7_VITBC|nr:unnamed protein product [Vitrella brassicaformis CCMP3155]|eukprot:CEM00571.1 unnamed protein product [Vitrella brassicaformis CCMP3155]
MKFGKQLTHYAVPEWANEYINYNELKKLLPGDERRASVASQEGAPAEQPLLGEADQEKLRMFDIACERELAKVNRFFENECNLLEQRIEHIEAAIRENLGEELRKKSADAAAAAASAAASPPTVPLPPPAPARPSPLPIIPSSSQAEEPLSPTPQQAPLPHGLHTGGVSSPSIAIHGPREPQPPDTADSSPNHATAAGAGAGGASEASLHLSASFGGPSHVRQVSRGESFSSKDKGEKDKEKKEKKEKKDEKWRRMYRGRIQRVLCNMYTASELLEQYSSLNYMGFYKIWKKRDKLCGVERLAEDIMRVREQPFKKLDRVHRLQKKCSDLYRLITDDKTSDHFKIQQEMLKELSKHVPGQDRLFFFLGACMVLLLDIVVMCYMEPTNPDYTLDEVLANFPIFRMVLSIILVNWGIGACMHLLEHYRVNYRFMLDIDPKCQVAPSHFFLVAAIQTTSWIVIFGCYLADLKFLNFGPHNLYFLYPVVLIAVQVAIAFLPSDTFRRKYRWEIVECVGYCFYAAVWPFVTVTFVQNIVGDVLTSMAKPLADLEYTVCYYSTGLYHRETVTCSGVDFWLKPLIVATPYYIRLMQCISRFLEADDAKRRTAHAANTGKYCAGILVVICTSIPWHEYGLSIYVSRLVWVFTYIFATIYMFFWDVYMDWGLAFDPDNYLRPQRMYPPWLYYSISLVNLFGRLSWAMNLMPIEILDNERLNSNLITLWVSTMEILRRTLWALIRLENEHLTNSSRYRAMLWVPPLLGAESGHVTEVLEGNPIKSIGGGKKGKDKDKDQRKISMPRIATMG